jgi:hypothetical protein
MTPPSFEQIFVMSYAATRDNGPKKSAGEYRMKLHARVGFAVSRCLRRKN